MIDIRSDTTTKPTQRMKEAILTARVGDDIYGEDPTVLELQKKAASLFGMEDGKIMVYQSSILIN